jgi:hypothetical protein
MTCSREGGSGLPSSKRHDMWPPPTLVMTTPWLEDTPATQAMMMVPPWVLAPWLDTILPFV